MKRFWAKVEKTKTCWLWTAGSRGVGYGAFKYEGKCYDAHRFVWFLKYKKWPTEWILHKCNNRSCVRPKHLYEGTPLQNFKDMLKNGNSAVGNYGEENSMHKLTEQEVREIRERYRLEAFTFSQLGRIYHVDPSTIRYIIRGKAWSKLL